MFGSFLIGLMRHSVVVDDSGRRFEIGGVWKPHPWCRCLPDVAECCCGAIDVFDGGADVLGAPTVRHRLSGRLHRGSRVRELEGVTIQVASQSADEYPIVVGVDGSPASLAALRWAVQDATAHAVPLWVVHVLDPRERHRAPYAPASTGDEEETDAVAIAEELIGRDAPASVRRIFEVGPPARMLLRHCAEARMLVLGHDDGHRRSGPVSAADPPALGPTARACLRSAPCPVVVVPVPIGDRTNDHRPAQPGAEATSGPRGDLRAPAVFERAPAASSADPDLKHAMARASL